jgi:CRISPR type III-A-associated RAMP protein Csm5
MTISDSINLGKEVAIEIITPVHVGGASEKIMRRGVDFFYRENRLMLFNFSDMLRVIMAKNVGIETVTNLLADNRVRELENYILSTLRVQSGDFTYKELKMTKDPGNEIRPLIRNGTGQPYIPGSSIKGALRSVIFNNLYGATNAQHSDIKDFDDSKILGNFDRSIMRFIRVGEPVFSNNDTVIDKIDLFNLYKNKNDRLSDWESDWKNGFNLWVEYLKPGTKSTFRLNIALPLIKSLVNGYGKSDYLSQNISGLMGEAPFEVLRGIVNRYTKKHIERELKFFNKFDQAHDTPELIENLENLIAYTQSPDSCLFRMAYGSGFHGITGDWRFKDHTATVDSPDDKNWVYSPTQGRKAPAHYKSRKIIGKDPKLMGFVKLTF